MVSAVLSLAVKVTTPLPFEGPLAAEMLELPWFGDSVTVLPLTGFPPASRSVTVTVEVAIPSASTALGFAVTVETVALTGPVAMAKLVLIALARPLFDAV